MPISEHWEFISFSGPNFPGMCGLILVLMSNAVLLGRNFDFLGGYLVVTARYLVVTAGYCSLPGS